MVGATMSIKLPHKLATWESQLRIFPEETALALGPLVQKVAALLGPFPHHHVEGHVVPDGFAGLDKRGTYDRLIASDWLLADELPDEFMRRSVMGEHLFWKVAYREPTQARSTLVLFDAGPEQLGTPRLLHIAALAVFEVRAQMANANFNWGVLQSGEQGLLPGMNVTEVEMLLEARGSTSAHAEHFVAWLRRASEAGHKGEIWVVGSERLRQFLPNTFSSLLITDLLSPGERKLRAACQPAGKHARQIELELPAPAACAQLLRDPFSAAVASRRILETSSALQNLVFNPPGNKLWARTEKGDLMVLPVPNSPRETVGKSKHHETLSRFPQVAVGRVGRTTVLVSMNPVSGALNLVRFGKPLSHGLAEGEYEFLDLRTKPLFRYGSLSLCVWHGGEKAGLYLLDEAGSLLRLFGDQDGKRRCEIVHHHTLTMTLARSGFCYAAYDGKDGGHVRFYANGHFAPIQSWPEPEVPVRAFFGYAPLATSLPFGLLALGYEDYWDICHLSGRIEIEVPRTFSVHGVVQDESYEATLIVVEGEGHSQTLSLHGKHGTRRLLKTDSPITAVCGCQQLPFIAYVTEAGELSVYSLKHGKAVLDFAWRAT
jgi:hypothetical protein